MVLLGIALIIVGVVLILLGHPIGGRNHYW